ncbi:MAG TPA: DUF1653 domain-containing protein [Candidatus Paceibacterota bacterium]
MDVIPGTTYVHKKGGRYIILHIADESTNKRTGNKVVVYQSIALGKIHTRDLDEFTELVEWPDGTQKPRFILEE